MERDRHHIPSHKSKSQWRASVAGRAIIETPSLIPRIERPIHELINEHCPMVPVLGLNSLLMVAREFDPTMNTLEDLDRLLICIERASKHPRADETEKAVCELAIHAMSTQVPYLKLGMINEKS